MRFSKELKLKRDRIRGGTVFEDSSSSVLIYSDPGTAALRWKGNDENFTGTQSQVTKTNRVFVSRVRKRAWKLVLRKPARGDSSYDKALLRTLDWRH